MDNLDSETFSTKQNDDLKLFMDMTGCGRSVAITCLERVGWSLDAAANNFFSSPSPGGVAGGDAMSGGGSASGGISPDGGDEDNFSSTSRMPLLQSSGAEEPATIEGVPGTGGASSSGRRRRSGNSSGSRSGSVGEEEASVETEGMNSVDRRNWLMKLFSHTFTFLVYLSRRFCAALGNFVFGRSITTGEAFGNVFEQNYGAVHPKFSNLTFDATVRKAREDRKIVFVYLHCVSARDTDRVCREVLASDFVIPLLDENFMTYGGDIHRMESHNISRMLKVRQYPYCAVVLPASSIDDLHLVGSLEGVGFTLDALVALLTVSVDEHRQILTDAPVNSALENRLLREEQDREFEEAQRADAEREIEQERLRKEAEEQEVVRQEELQRQQEEVEKLRLQRELTEERRKGVASVFPPAVSPGVGITKICIRLASGSVVRLFKEDATIDDLYKWVDCCSYLPENEGKKIQIPMKFKLQSAFPAKLLDDREMTMKDAALCPNAALRILDEDDD